MKVAFLITFTDGSEVSAWTDSEASARALALAFPGGRQIATIARIPHPARPRVDADEGWGSGQCPSFCYQPTRCAGKTACPARPACTS